MAMPPLYLLQRLRALRGDAFVTFPHGSLDYKQVERTYNVPRSQDPDSFLASDGEYSGTSLTEQRITGGDAQYVEIYQKYETLPGPVLARPGFNPEYGNATTEYRQRVALPAAADGSGIPITGQVIVDCYVEPGESVLVGTRVTLTWAIPPSRIERESIGFEFPAQFEFIGGWALPVAPGFKVSGPFPGVTHTLTAHRTLSTAASVSITYSSGAPSVTETIWSVTTPGKADRFFGIGANTIHNAIYLVETELAGTQIVESLPASTPSSYTPGTTLTIRASCRLIKGTIWEKRVTTCVE